LEFFIAFAVGVPFLLVVYGIISQIQGSEPWAVSRAKRSIRYHELEIKKYERLLAEGGGDISDKRSIEYHEKRLRLAEIELEEVSKGE
jgi:hypothetical protein